MDFSRIDPELHDGLKMLQASMPLGANLSTDLAASRAAASARNGHDDGRFHAAG